MTRRPCPLLLACARALAAGCGEKSEPGGDARSGKPSRCGSCSTTSPTPTTPASTPRRRPGEYDRAGLDVEIKPPPDPSAPLKLLRAGPRGRRPLLRARAAAGARQGRRRPRRGRRARAEAADLADGAARLEDQEREGPRGQARRHRRDRLPVRLPEDDPRQGGRRPGHVKETNVGFDLMRPLITKRVDATLGAFWNYEGVDLQRRGKKPVILKMDQLGVPTYNELVFVARREDFDENGSSRLRRFLQATARGHRALREDPSVGRRRAAGGRLGPGPRAADGRREGDAAGVLPRGRGPHVRLDGPRRSGRPTGPGWSRTG